MRAEFGESASFRVLPALLFPRAVFTDGRVQALVFVVVRFTAQQAMPSPDGHGLGSNAQLRAEFHRCQEALCTQTVVTRL
jgi:hypothetical protein